MSLKSMAVALSLCLAGAALAETERTITVTGEGQVSAEPDMATIVVAVEAQADTPAEALDMASAATQAILARLDTEGLDPGAVRTGAIRLVPQYGQGVLSSGRQIVSYQALNSVEAEVTDLARLGGLLAAVVGDGANRLDGVRFGLQDPSAAMDEARRLAVAEGARRAELYAEAAGVPLGDLVTLNESGVSGYRPVMAEPVVMEMAMSSPRYDVPTAPGQIDLSASVVMVYEIAEQ